MMDEHDLSQPNPLAIVPSIATTDTTPPAAPDADGVVRLLRAAAEASAQHAPTVTRCTLQWIAADLITRLSAEVSHLTVCDREANEAWRAVAAERDRLSAELAAERERVRLLRACVEAADRMRYVMDGPTLRLDGQSSQYASCRDYDTARAALAAGERRE